MATKLDYTEVHRSEWSTPTPPHLGSSGGTDYFTAVYSRATWPDDGSAYVGITYEDKFVWIGNAPGALHTVVEHSNYPVAV